MTHCVVLERQRLLEELPADAARERLQDGVRRLVLFQLVAAGKALAAGDAGVRLLSRVHSQVGLELVRTAKALSALLADVLFVGATPRGTQDSDRVGGTFRLDFHHN